jgi:hypothetical protein
MNVIITEADTPNEYGMLFRAYKLENGEIRPLFMTSATYDDLIERLNRSRLAPVLIFQRLKELSA